MDSEKLEALEKLGRPPRPVKSKKAKPCRECGSLDLKYWNCGYSSFNVCGMDCKGCGYRLKENGDATEAEIIELWNNQKRDPDKEIKGLRKAVRLLAAECWRLRRLQAPRAKGYVSNSPKARAEKRDKSWYDEEARRLKDKGYRHSDLFGSDD